MTALRDKVLMPDGEHRIFNYADVQAAVIDLKQRVSGLSNKALINSLINEVFSDVIMVVTKEFKDEIKKEGR